MKLIGILLFIIFNSIYVCSQQVTLEKTWIAKDYTRLKFNRDTAHLSLSEFGFSSNYIILNDTLRFVEIGNPNKTRHDYKMILSRDSLILIPLNIHSNILESGQKPISFVDRNLMVDEHFKFKSLKFRNVGGNIEWKDFSVVIDKKGNIKFKEQNGGYNKPALYYKGKLNKNQLKELIDILKKSEIDKLTLNQKYVYHGTTTTLDIQYNNKSKYLKQQYYPPTFWELTNYLSRLPKIVNLKPSKAFEIFPPDPESSIESVLKSLPGFQQ